MNLQTVVDTLQEVRALRGPARERLTENHVAQGHGLQGAKLGAVPSIAPTLCYLLLPQFLLDGAKRLFCVPPPPTSELGRDQPRKSWV